MLTELDLTGWVLMSAVAYGLTAVLTLSSLTAPIRKRATEYRNATVADTQIRKPWRWTIHWLEEGIFCTWCVSFWFAMATVAVLSDVELWAGTFAVWTGTLILHRWVGKHSDIGMTYLPSNLESSA